MLNDDAPNFESISDKDLLQLSDGKIDGSSKLTGQKLVGLDCEGNVSGPEISKDGVSVSSEGASLSTPGVVALKIDQNADVTVGVEGCTHCNSGLCAGASAKISSPAAKAVSNNIYKAMTPVQNPSTGNYSSWLERQLGKLDFGGMC